MEKALNNNQLNIAYFNTKSEFDAEDRIAMAEAYRYYQFLEDEDKAKIPRRFYR